MPQASHGLPGQRGGKVAFLTAVAVAGTTATAGVAVLRRRYP